MTPNKLEDFLETKLKEGEVVLLKRTTEDFEIEYFYAANKEYSLLANIHPSLYGYLLVQNKKITDVPWIKYVLFSFMAILLLLNTDISFGKPFIHYLQGWYSLLIFIIFIFYFSYKLGTIENKRAEAEKQNIQKEIAAAHLPEIIVSKCLIKNTDTRKIISFWEDKNERSK